MTDWKQGERVTEVLYCNPEGPIPTQLGVIAIEIQFLDTDPGTADDRKLFIREMAEEMHDRLIEKGQGYERHQVAFRLSELTAATELNDAIAADADKVPIAGKPGFVH